MRYKERIRSVLEILDADLTDVLTRDDYDLDKTSIGGAFIGGAFDEVAEVELALERLNKPHKFEKYLELRELHLKGRLAIMEKIRAKAGDIRRKLIKEIQKNESNKSKA